MILSTNESFPCYLIIATRNELVILSVDSMSLCEEIFILFCVTMVMVAILPYLEGTVTKNLK